MTMTRATTTAPDLSSAQEPTAASGVQKGIQKVVVVNACRTILQLLEAVLDSGHYDLAFVETCEHAYSQVKRLHPDLVVLCARIDDAASFQLLSMLKLDDDTRSIPVVTYTTEYDDADTSLEAGTVELSDTHVFSHSPTVRMH
jgi:PleD family two-component response regulator